MYKDSKMTMCGLPARHIVLEDELYVAVKQTDIDKLIFKDGIVTVVSSTQETQ